MPNYTNWVVAAFDEPSDYVAIAPAMTTEDYKSSHPGCYNVKGPFATQFGAQQWYDENKSHWPPPPPAKKKSGNGGGNNGNGGGNPPPTGNPPTSGSGGTWWVIVIGTTSQNVHARVVQATSKPAVPAGKLSQVLGPFKTKDEAYTADLDTLGKETTAKDSNPVSATLTGIDAIDNFLKALENPATWIRVGKVIAGAALILLGINKLTGASGKIENVAGALPKVIPV